ncbi:glycosyltransferase family 4 protein [Pelobium sp.]|nr:glycosyltransferase family 1 protein [Pelobium sp.]MDA9555257.1 glycosyltransferase family 4 protein [Pelobium sp.]
MKIGFEAKRAFKNFTGLGNYARSVIKTLVEVYPEEHFFAYTTDPVQNSRTNFLFSYPNLFIKSAPIKWLKSYWRSFGIIKDLKNDGIDIYHGLSHEIPSGLKKHGIKSVVTIHDLIYLRYPQYFKSIDRKIYDFKFKSACQNADRIIAISEQTKQDIIHFFSTPEDKIEVVYQGCDPIFYVPQKEEKLDVVKTKYQLSDDFLLCVGTIENRKNQLLILRALADLPSHIQLVLVGKHTSYQQILQDFISLNQLQNRVHFLQNVDFLDLPSIYQLAKIFVYPSKFEGFGIPILEALNCGVPVIAATGSCLEEAGGPDSLYIQPDDVHQLKSAILSIYDDEVLKQKMINNGKRFALQFREDKIAANLMAIYQKTLKDA